MLLMPPEISAHAASSLAIKTFDTYVQIVIIRHQNIIHTNAFSNVENLPSLLAVTPESGMFMKRSLILPGILGGVLWKKVLSWGILCRKFSLVCLKQSV